LRDSRLKFQGLFTIPSIGVHVWYLSKYNSIFSGPDKRERERNFIPHVENPVVDIFEDATAENTNSDITLNNEINTTHESCGDVQLVTDEWDKEVEETWQERIYSKGIQTKKIEIPIKEQLQDIIHFYPPAKQAYTEIAMYDSVFTKFPTEHNRNNGVSNGTVDMSGQFDDADWFMMMMWHDDDGDDKDCQ